MVAVDPGRRFVSLRGPACSQAVPTDSQFCPACGAPVAPPAGGATAPYLSSPTPKSLDSDRHPDRPRFVPGTLLADRFRIVSALGKGGMGEVYRADDLALGQTVALKFLPPHLTNDPDRLGRFRTEV